MSATRKVLVVDDDPVVGKSFGRVLSQKGYAVITAESGAQALEKMREQAYDMVFTDIKMPGMSGIELTEQIKAQQPWMPVVIVTGFGSKDNEERARAAGVSDFLNKPLSPEMIEQTAERAMMAQVEAVVAPVQAEVAQPEMAKPRNKLVNIALFLAAPFIGLFYAVMLPVVGAAMLASMVYKALDQFPKTKMAVNVVMGPLVGLVYAVTLPVVGTAMIVRTAWQAFRAKPETV